MSTRPLACSPAATQSLHQALPFRMFPAVHSPSLCSRQDSPFAMLLRSVGKERAAVIKQHPTPQARSQRSVGKQAPYLPVRQTPAVQPLLPSDLPPQGIHHTRPSAPASPLRLIQHLEQSRERGRQCIARPLKQATSALQQSCTADRPSLLRAAKALHLTAWHQH